MEEDFTPYDDRRKRLLNKGDLVWEYFAIRTDGKIEKRSYNELLVTISQVSAQSETERNVDAAGDRAFDGRHLRRIAGRYLLRQVVV